MSDTSHRAHFFMRTNSLFKSEHRAPNQKIAVYSSVILIFSNHNNFNILILQLKYSCQFDLADSLKVSTLQKMDNKRQCKTDNIRQCKTDKIRQCKTDNIRYK